VSKTEKTVRASARRLHTENSEELNDQSFVSAKGDLGPARCLQRGVVRIAALHGQKRGVQGEEGNFKKGLGVRGDRGRGARGKPDRTEQHGDTLQRVAALEGGNCKKSFPVGGKTTGSERKKTPTLTEVAIQCKNATASVGKGKGEKRNQNRRRDINRSSNSSLSPE